MLQLAHDNAEAEHDQASDRRYGAGDDQRIAETELIDRHAKSDQGGADRDSESAYDVKQNRHGRLRSSKNAANSTEGPLQFQLNYSTYEEFWPF